MTFEFVSSSRKDPEKVACLRPSATHCWLWQKIA